MILDDIKRIALEVLEEQLEAPGITIYSFGYQADRNQRRRLRDAIAQDIADRVTREAT